MGHRWLERPGGKILASNVSTVHIICLEVSTSSSVPISDTSAMSSVVVVHIFYVVLPWFVVRAFAGDCGVTTSNKARGYHITYWVCCFPMGHTTSLLLSLHCLDKELSHIVSLKPSFLFSHGLS